MPKLASNANEIDVSPATSEANDLIDHIADHASLDELMARSAAWFTPERRRDLVRKLRADRAAWEIKRDGGTRSKGDE